MNDESVVSTNNGATPTPQPPQPTPTPNPATEHKFTEADLQKVREQEKNKLYPKIEDLKTNLSKAEQKAKDLESRLTSLETEKQKLEDSKLSDTEKTQRDIAVLTNKIEEITRQHSDSVSKLQEDVRKSALEAYRVKAISAAGPGIIPSMINGDNKEAIDAAIEMSKSEFQRIRETVRTEFNTLSDAEKANEAARRTAAAAALPVPPVTSPASASGSVVDLAKSVSSMTSEEYARHRADILKQVKS